MAKHDSRRQLSKDGVCLEVLNDWLVNVRTCSTTYKDELNGLSETVKHLTLRNISLSVRNWGDTSWTHSIYLIKDFIPFSGFVGYGHHRHTGVAMGEQCWFILHYRMKGEKLRHGGLDRMTWNPLFLFYKLSSSQSFQNKLLKLIEQRLDAQRSCLDLWLLL